MTPAAAPLAEETGRLYELFANRGVLYKLIECGLLTPESPALAAWLDIDIGAAIEQIFTTLNITDPTLQQRIRSLTEHVGLTAFLNGYAVIRGWLDALPEGDRTLRGVFAPLTPIGGALSQSERSRQLANAFDPAFARIAAGLTHKGMPANADFACLIGDSEGVDHLLIAEYSHLSTSNADFGEEIAHAEELRRRQTAIASRSVFTRITAEVSGENFTLKPAIAGNLAAFSTGDRPLYKLCQASAYAYALSRLLISNHKIANKLETRAIALTSTGVESLAARFSPDESFKAEADPRARLMADLGDAYCRATTIASEAELDAAIEQAFDAIVDRLPAALAESVRSIKLTPGHDFNFVHEEPILAFHNPATPLDPTRICALIPHSEALTRHFKVPAAQAIAPLVEPPGTLRDLHAAAVTAGIEAARRGHLNIIALEGNPGIGKTTAVRKYLRRRAAGFLFLYISPRVAINNEVFNDLAGTQDAPSGILTLTSNSELIRSARPYADKHRDRYGRDFVDRAVKRAGAPHLSPIMRSGPTIYIGPESDDEIDAIPTTGVQKTTISATEDHIGRKPSPGVLRTICEAARRHLAIAPALDKLAITAAIQTLRETTSGRNSARALSRIFAEKASTLPGLAERREFAKRCPTIIAMVDEIAGDGAGAPFVHALAEWLNTEFIEPFDGDSPFTVILIPSDASLASDAILERYLASGDQDPQKRLADAPDKILIAPSKGQSAFDLSVSPLTLNGVSTPALHIMTNSFPAQSLTLTVKIAAASVDLTNPKDPNRTLQPHIAARNALDERLTVSAVNEILAALAANAEQVIYFAQDKLGLAAIQEALAEDPRALALGLERLDIEILDSSVPARKRKEILAPKRRDALKVILMTSSGSRGLSFPLTDVIIAAMPRFNVEAALMELSQLIYRGRGRSSAGVSKDADGRRRLVFLVNDVLICEPHAAPDRRAWLRQACDFLTFIVMLRATLFTRISGDAALANRLALVPVGAIGVEKTQSFMTDSIATFIREARIARGRSANVNLGGLLTSADDAACEIFRSAEITAQVEHGRHASTYTSHAFRDQLRQSALNDPLRGLRASREAPLIPRHINFDGPAVIERWPDDASITEAYRIDTSNPEKIRAFKGALSLIGHDLSLPKSLRTAAHAALVYITRERVFANSHNQQTEPTFRFSNTLSSSDLVLSLPIDFDGFLAANHARYAIGVTQPELWFDLLPRLIARTNATLPPVPTYRTFPFACGLIVEGRYASTAMNDKYFAASSELNVLNALT